MPSIKRLLLIGDGLSAFGSWVDFLAILTLAAYQYHVTPYQMAVVSAAGLLPGMLAAPAIGRLCDRRSPKNLLLLSIAGRATITAGIIASHDYAVFLSLICLRSACTAVAPPAINALAIRAIAPTGLAHFYSLLNVLNSSAKIVAPTIGTISASLASETFALAVSVLFSAAALVAFTFVQCSEPARMASAATSAAGVDTPPTRPSFVPLLWLAGTYAFFVFMVNNLFPLVLQQAGFDKSALGILVSCSGAGNVLSGLWLARRSAAGAVAGASSAVLRPALLQAASFALIGSVLRIGIGNDMLVLPGLFFLTGMLSARYAIAFNIYLSTHYARAIGAASGLVQAWQNGLIFAAPYWAPRSWTGSAHRPCSG